MDAQPVLTQQQRRAVSKIAEEDYVSLEHNFKSLHGGEKMAIDTSKIETSEHIHAIPPSQEDVMAAECREITTPFILRDQHGRIILAYSPTRIPDFIASKTRKQLRTLLDSEFGKGLAQLHVPKDEARHRKIDTKRLDETYGKGRFGVLRCACWFEQGKRALTDSRPTVNREMCNGSGAFDIHTRLLSIIDPLRATVSRVLAEADPIAWRRLVDHCRKLDKYVPAVGTLIGQHNSNATWISLSLVVNTPVRIHVDSNDDPNGFSGICLIGGTPSGAWLVVPSAGVKFRLDPLDIILLRTRTLPHFVHHTGKKGRSFTIVNFFNHSPVMDWVRARHRDHKDKKAAGQKDPGVTPAKKKGGDELKHMVGDSRDSKDMEVDSLAHADPEE